MTNEKKSPAYSPRLIAMIGVMGAVVFAVHYIPRIPIGMGPFASVHVGNSSCLLAGFILGPIPGGIAAGIGTFFYSYGVMGSTLPTAIFAMIFKGLMGYFCGLIAYGGGAETRNPMRNYLAAIAGQVIFMSLHLSRAYIVDRFLLAEITPEMVLVRLTANSLASTINAVAAVLISVPLAFTLRKGLEKAGIGVRS